MKRFIVVALLALVMASPAHAAFTIGFSTGIASAKGKDSNHTYSDFNPLSIFFSIIGDSEYAVEFGYSQIADIEESDATESTSVSLGGFFLAGRYFAQFSGNGFGYVKLGVHHWSGTARLSEVGSSDNTTKASGRGHGFTPLIGFGADFVFPGGDYGIRIEFEHLNNIGDGLYDNTVVNDSKKFVSEGYSYDRLNFGFIVAF